MKQAVDFRTHEAMIPAFDSSSETFNGLRPYNFVLWFFVFILKKLTNQISPQAKILDTLTIVEQNCICKMSELDI